MATYYVATDGNNADTGGLLDPWADPGYAAQQMVSGDVCYVKSGTYTITTSTPGAGGPVQFTTQIKALMEGYSTTPGDKCAGGSLPVLIVDAAYSPPPTMSIFYADGYVATPQTIAYMKADGNGRPNTRGFNAAASVYSYFIGCVAANTSDTGFLTGRCTQCKAVDCTGAGFQQLVASYCVSEGCSTGFNACGTCFSCISNGDGTGFYGLNQVWIGCIAYNSTGRGFWGARNDILNSCIAVDAGTYSFDITAGGALINCADYNPTTSRLNATPQLEYNPITLANNPFPNAASGDFTIDSSAAGLVLRNVGIVL